MTADNRPRLIEVAFPLKQASLDSVHEKNVRHGHISTLHIWPARRPLAASRAALIATLLPAPEKLEERQELVEKLGGKVKKVVKRKTLADGRSEEKISEETEGGVLHWGRETENKETLDWFRQEIRKAYGGRAPRVLDPFAGGGAIPLEAMRLGCETTAIDINPVAWFLLKCTLDYPQRLAGQKRPLPGFALRDRAFMEAFFKAQGYKGKQLRVQIEKMGLGDNAEPQIQGVEWGSADLQADLAWQVRAWGRWVLSTARESLARYYPTYADFETLVGELKEAQQRETRLVPVKSNGALDIATLNGEFNEEYLRDPRNPRWIAKPTVAYLWARSIECKNCRARIPLLKTRWLSKSEGKRVLLTIVPSPDKTSVVLGIDQHAPEVGGNAAQKRAHDKRIGGGTMSRVGATCPNCGVINTTEDIRIEGQAGRIENIMTAVVMEGPTGKEYRLPFDEEWQAVKAAQADLKDVFESIPFGLPSEPLPPKETLGFRVPLYGLDRWHKLFTPRQLIALGILVKQTRAARDEMQEPGYDQDWSSALMAYLAIALDRTANYMSTICVWAIKAEEIKQTFLRFALPMTWDFAEANPLAPVDRFYNGAISNVGRVLSHVLQIFKDTPAPKVLNRSAVVGQDGQVDVVVTDPPYYDAIPYSDLMDFFYVWLRRVLSHDSSEESESFAQPLGPKWNHESSDGELIDDSSRFEGNKDKSKAAYENGMYRAFEACYRALGADGRLVIVFAHKQPDAWETLVSAIIRAGFVVDASYPIVTEMRGGVRNLNRASLASSIWLVCRKRAQTARPGWDGPVLEEMSVNIRKRLREFWDAGVRGPDFVWSATGPALEAFSKHPVVKKANEPGRMMSVSEFLRQVRRLVVDFVVGRVLTGGVGEEVSGLDDVTTYYLLHRNDFGFEEAPAGACILYAVSCNLSDTALSDQYDLVTRSSGQIASGDGVEDDDDDESLDTDGEGETGEGSGSKVRLKTWNQRARRQMGVEAPGGRPVPLIDQVHRLMHLWRAGDQVKVDDYLDDRGLRQNKLFHQLLQALIELAPAGGEERSLLESVSNHVAARGVMAEKPQMKLVM